MQKKKKKSWYLSSNFKTKLKNEEGEQILAGPKEKKKGQDKNKNMKWKQDGTTCSN